MKYSYNDVLKYVVEKIKDMDSEIVLALISMDEWRCPLNQAKCGEEIEDAILSAISDYEIDNDDRFEEEEVLNDILSNKDIEDILFDALDYKDELIESVRPMKSLKKRLNEARHANVGTIELESRSWLFGHTSKGFFGWVYYGWILQDGEEIGFYELNDQDYNRPYITLYVSEETKKQWKDTKKRRADVPKKEIIDFVLNSRLLKRYKQGNHGIEDVYIKTYKDYIRKVDSGKYPKGISTEGKQWAEFCNTFQRFTGERFAHPYGYYMDLEEPREVRIAAQKYADLMHLV